MGRSFGVKDLKASKVAALNKELIDQLEGKGKKKGKRKIEDCDQVKWMWGQLAWWSITENVEVVREFKFHDERKWRFDFAIPAHKIGIEYEGLNSEKSGHTTLSGYTGDTDKYREASILGWILLRYTVKNYKNLLKDVSRCIQKNGKSGVQDTK